MYKILIADTNGEWKSQLQKYLVNEGYEVLLSDSGRQALHLAEQHIPDLILLNINLHQLDGIETCAELRVNFKTRNSIIAFVTERIEDYSQVLAFEAGADDFIRKPIKPRVLFSRIKALLRRKENLQNNVNRIKIGDMIIDMEKYQIERAGKKILLPKKEFEMLALFISKPGKVFSREIIMQTLWGGNVVVGDRTIDVHISKLRDKVGENTIKTIKGIGYKIEI